MPGTDPCVSNWVGIDCDTTGNIITLNLTHVGLQGPVPKAVGRLTSLLHLDMGNNKVCTVLCGPWNHVTGDLAPLASLLNLQTLILTSNELSLPSFPTAVFQLTKLIDLRFDNTLIKGELPVQLSTLHNLKYLYLGNNSFTGSIPGAALGSLTNLQELTIWGNALTGVIPAELGNLVNLTYLNVNKNNLYGGLPPELGKLTQLRKFLLYKNKFTGPIPEEWRGMISIQDLEINANALYGPLPPWLLQMPKLSILQLSNNQLRGSTIPVLNASVTPGLNFLYVECNYLEGARPQLQNITALLDYNCWENESSLDSACVRPLNCLNFQLSVNNGKSCPACPSGQHMVNTTTCICFEDPGGSSKKFPLAAVVAVVVAVASLLLLVMCYFLWRVRQKRKKQALLSHPDYFQTEKESSMIMQSWEVPRGVHHFTMEELMKATNGFDQANEIGEGGFGKVFVGNFPDGRTLAIKRAGRANYSSASGCGQFRNEVSLLSRLHHKNLVRLEGFCDDGNQQILVYEYMKLGNLHSHLHGSKEDQNMILDWYKRLEIAVNVAQGLDYLHSFADPPVIHRDVKPSNILLDDHLVAKVADFGISKESPELDTHVSTRPAGTAGYFDPQYFLLRQLTTASDVYSFGVVLLELITGRKAIEFNCPEEESNLVEWTKAKMTTTGQGGIESVVDPELGSNYPRDVFMSLVDLGLRCASLKRNIRPTMKFVVSVLEPLLQESERPSCQS
uniref:Leucine-rich repeat receptor-like protein kinase n=1 Tax=Pohlia nutans TaxID=140635 RepID=A0A1P8DYY5_9BRYO|nr:leucine-rich repeat receptor-like protein kinase [Pohlia nutans]